MTHDVKAVFFIGAGGIGMSALERYFLAKGYFVAGYDKTPGDLTKELEKEGVHMHYEDDVNLIPEQCKDKEHTLVVYTPAIPASHSELKFFQKEGFNAQKRAQVLGTLTRQMKGLCVAGTHGKTTTTAMLAHLLRESKVGCNAFLGGITKNYGTNYLINASSPYVVIEADEYDRSFHHLRPYATVITSTDADHLDIYGTEEAYLESFQRYTELIQPGGALIMHRNLRMKERLGEGVKKYDYDKSRGDFHAENICIGNGKIVFDFISPLGNIKGVELGVPVSINIENGIAAMALAQIAGAETGEIKRSMATFKGVDRRFDFRIKDDSLVFLSDYAHHPEELRQSILSVKEVFSGRKLCGIFQPHLYTRTRDFYKDFAKSLSLLDEVILLDIYPARELPIEGVSSRLIYEELPATMKKRCCSIKEIDDILKTESLDIVMVLGAGDVENQMKRWTKILKEKKQR